MLVHPSARRRGIARALMMRAEETARQAARSLLVLDTRTGDKAEPLYRSLGFALVGIVPAYACSTEGVLEFDERDVQASGNHLRPQSSPASARCSRGAVRCSRVPRRLASHQLNRSR